MRTNFEYREIGKQKLKRNTKELILMFFIYALITNLPQAPYYTTVTEINDITFTQQHHFLSWISILLLGPMTYGLCIVVKKSYNGMLPKYDDLFLGFKNYVNNFVLGLLRSLFIALWSILFIIPGIVAAIKYSMAFYVHLDNPDLSPMECIDESKKIMNGHKMDYFMLMLSYLGWIILGALTFGILYLWVIPWIYYSEYAFYLDITGKSENANVIDEAY